ncbi:LacI family DNA-binding transcriptional regulator [Alloscardovia criceti]|uniref:LacI family DNA-binding transcriptional regulator n=1 Tax=Alloscardovia criceti TaxID=356828 RepID=UPI0003643CC8|nr:LacI family DNA-binding transcriptional regulator [Alloscardovia criceti]
MAIKRAKRATLKDIARIAGVSSTAVSLVLNNKPNRFTEETRDHIRAIARDLNYVPNQSARNLATHSSSLLALIIPDIENLFFVSLAKHLEEECKKNGYSLLVVDSGEDVKEQESALRRMVQLGIDGLFMVPAKGTSARNEKLRQFLSNLDFPVIFIDRIPDLTPSHAETGQGAMAASSAESSKEHGKNNWAALAYDHRMGGRMAAEYLVSKGHQRFGYIGPVEPANKDSRNNTERFEGFVEGLNQRGITIEPACLVSSGFSVSEGSKHADDLIDAGVTAVFCGNDLIAIGFSRRARERGIRIPEDISIIGYDDVMPAFGLDFDITSMRQNVADLAQRGFAMMKAYRATQLVSQERITLLEPQLIERSTVSTIEA